MAGIETAGIPHSSALAFVLNAPSVFVRKQIKDHGTKSRIEGGKVAGKKVLLIEDLVTTGDSSLSGVEALRREGATVTDCLVIITYGFKESVQAFAGSKVHLHTLTSFPVVLDEALGEGKISNEESVIIKEWFNDPQSWSYKPDF